MQSFQVAAAIRTVPRMWAVVERYELMLGIVHAHPFAAAKLRVAASSDLGVALLRLSLEPRKRRTTGMKKGMEEAYIEDLANRDGPVHALVSGEGAAKRWFRGAAGPSIEPRNREYWGADVLWFSGRQHRWRCFREPSADPAGS